MKIGILTLPLHTNYGGILQAYALQTVLERMGHEVVVIDKIPKYHYSSWYRDLFSYPVRFCKKWLTIGHQTEIRIEFYARMKALFSKKNTEKFVNKHINRVKVNSLNDINENLFDAIIVGSDQIWRPDYVRWYYRVEDVFLSFTKGWKIRRMSYAASFGIAEWKAPATTTKKCIESLRSFDYISVREENAVKICKDVFSTDAKLVLDPTLLLDKEDYLSLLDDTCQNCDRKFVMTYILDNSNAVYKLISKISEREKIPFVETNMSDSVVFNKRVIKVQPKVEKWLQGFRDSSLVITDSFHACVFSIIFHKPFIVIANEYRGMSRIESLLKLFGLENHYIREIEEYTSTSEYSIPNSVYDKLKLLRSDSLSFLNNINRVNE